MAGLQSLVLITVDCLRADHVGFLGYRRPTTPFLDRLAEQSVVFSQASAAGTPTYYSFPAILASRHPLALGRDVLGLSPHEPTLAATLKDSGYATAAFLAANPYLSPRFGYHTGFDTFRDFLDTATAASNPGNSGKASLRTRLNQGLADACRKLGPLASAYDELYFQYCQRVAAAPPQSLDALRRYPAADVIVDHAADWLKNIGERPFFLWLHLMDPHSPYYPPQAALHLMGKGLAPARIRYLNSYWNRGDLQSRRFQRHRDEIIALYDAGVRWVDIQLARLADILRQAGAWERCLFAVTADHGEEFLDHGGRYHSPSQLSEELIRVPLLVHAPNQVAPRNVSAPFSLLHLAPTLLEAAGAPVPEDFCGRSHWRSLLSGEDWDEPVFAECVTGCSDLFRPSGRLGNRVLAVREGCYKLVFDFASSREQLFDLHRDPGELYSLPSAEEKSVRARLLSLAIRHLAHTHPRRASARLDALLRDLRLATPPSPEPYRAEVA